MMAIGVNQQATDTMLAGLNNVKIEDLNRFLTQQGVIVRPTVGRKRFRVSMPKEVLGIDKNNPFYKDYGDAGSFSILKKSDEAELQRLEGQLRHKAKSLAVGFDGKFMPIEVYKKDFVPFYQDIKAEYFALRDKICGNWTQIVDEFKASLHTFLIGLPTYSVELEKQLTAGIPDAHTVANSFYMNVRLSAFPVTENLSILDPVVSDEMKESIKGQAVEAVYDIMGNILNDVYGIVGQRIDDHANGREFNGRTIHSLASLRSRIEKNNILQHPLVNQVIDNLSEIIKLLDSRKSILRIDTLASLDEDVVEKMEEILIYIYGFSKEVGIELNETSAMSMATLEALYNASK